MASKKKKVSAGARRKVAGRTAVAAKPARKGGPAARSVRAATVVEARKASKVAKHGKGKKKRPKKSDVAPFRIALVNGRVQVTPKSGNRLCRKSQSRDISWELQAPGKPKMTFELVFRRAEFEGAGQASKDWPFDTSSSPPVGSGGSSTGPQTVFGGTLRAESDWTAYKYDVVLYDDGTQVGKLDPMIIIGKL
jgi:hypothetical protein